MFKTEIFRRSWRLFVVTLGQLKRHPKLLVLPVASMGCAVAMPVLFLSAMISASVLSRGESTGLDSGHWTPLLNGWKTFLTSGHFRIAPNTQEESFRFFDHFVTPENMIRVFFGYILLMSLPLMAGLLNAAFYNEGIRAFRGEGVSLLRGIGVAVRRFRPFLNWYIFSALTVGVGQMVGGRFGWVGRIAGSLLGLSWAAGSFFVIPILLREERPVTPPAELLRTSVALVKRTWGETAIGYVGLKVLGLPISVLALALGIGLRYFGSFTLGWVGAGLVAVAGMLLVSAVIKAADDLYRCALYVYATEGVVPEPFDQTAMEAAWKVKPAAAP